MSRIPSEKVRKAWDDFASLSPEELTRLVQELHRTQPVLLRYLRELQHLHLNAAEKQLLLFLCLTVWYVYKSVLGPGKPIEQEAFAKVAERNNAMFEYFLREPESDLDKSLSRVCERSQSMEVIRYARGVLLLALKEDRRLRGRKRRNRLREQNLGIMFFAAKNVTDALHLCYESSEAVLGQEPRGTEAKEPHDSPERRSAGAGSQDALSDP